MKSEHGTIRHESKGPSDDRPAYLAGGPYVLAIDTETNGMRWADGGLPFLVTASDYDRDFLWVLDPHHGADTKREHAECRRALLAADEWVFHNAPFDTHMLVAAGLITYEEAFERQVHDTHLMAASTLGRFVHVQDFKLKTLGQMFIGGDAKDDQDELKQAMVSLGLIQRPDQIKLPPEAFIETWRTYPEVVEKYAMKDTRLTYDLVPVLRERMNEFNARTYDFERAVQPTLIRMERRGMHVDPIKVAALKDQYTTVLAEELDQLREVSGDPDFNPNSKDSILPLMEAHGIELTDLTDTGEIRLDKGVLMRHAGTVPAVDTILSARVHEKFLSTYVAPMEDRDRVHPNFNQYGARTGRLSSYDPNWQNIPVRAGTEVREVIVPGPGEKLVVADYSSIELRLLAHYMGDDRLWDIIDNGDPFAWLGEQLYGTPDQTQWPVKRGPLKNGFYALTYGAGGPKLAQTIGGGMTDQEGRSLARQIKSALGPAYFDLTDQLKARARSRGYVRTITGRTQFIPRDDKGRTKDYVALNALIQGSAADIMKHALTIAEVETMGLGELRLTVHDELVMTATEDKADRCLERLVAAMKSAENLVTRGRLTLEVSGCVCDNYGAAKG